MIEPSTIVNMINTPINKIGYDLKTKKRSLTLITIEEEGNAVMINTSKSGNTKKQEIKISKKTKNTSNKEHKRK